MQSLASCKMFSSSAFKPTINLGLWVGAEEMLRKGQE